MRYLIPFFGLFVLSFSATAQLITPPRGNTFSFQPKFNPEVISKERIEKIYIKEEVKKDGDRIRQSDRSTLYRFDENGRTISVSVINHSLNDTAITFYEYKEGRLECEIKNDMAGMFSYCYTYGTDSLPDSKKYARTGTDHQAGPTDDISDISISTEKYAHEWYGNQLHTTIFNPSGRPYRKETRYYDEKGRLIKYLRNYVMSSAPRLEAYTYGDSGFLTEMTVEASDKTTRRTYEYDSSGNLLAHESFENGQMVSRREFVYIPGTDLLRAELQREELEKQIRISTYEYEYR